MSTNISWSSVINRSFFYTEYIAYELEQSENGIILRGWNKSIGNAYSNGSLFLQPEWIIHLINSIRSVPKDELKRGTDGSGYGEWSRHVSIPFDPNNKDLDFCISLTNTWYERSSPKLEIRFYLLNKKEDKIIHLPQFENMDSITLPHTEGIEGYIDDIEPVLEELEKYIPQEAKSKTLEPIGKPKSELEKKFEKYLKTLSESPENTGKPYIEWTTRQTDDTHYEVALYIFCNNKIDCEKKIICSTKAIAMISKYFYLWKNFVKTLPYRKENKIVQMEISSGSKHEGYSTIKITINESNDFFEIPFNNENPDVKLYTIYSYTDANRLSTEYLCNLHGFFQDEFLVLKFHSDEKISLMENDAKLFYISKKHAEALYKAIKNDIPFYLANPDSYRNNRKLEYDGFSIDLPYDSESPVHRIDIHSNDAVYYNCISMRCFAEDLVSEIHKIESVLGELIKNEAAMNFNHDLETVKWQLSHNYDRNNPVSWLEWQCDSGAKHKIELSEEKIYKIQEYIFWWWRATDHSEKYGFSDNEVFFEINPDSGKKDLGLLTLDFKNHRRDSIETYFDLNDGSNLPKQFYEFDCKDMIRKARIIDDAKELSTFHHDLDGILFEEYIFIFIWNSKYQKIDDGSRADFVIKRKHLDEFKSAVSELHDYLCHQQNKISDLLSENMKKKYDKEGFWISIDTCYLESDFCTKIDMEEDIPLHIVIYSKEYFVSDYFYIVGTRETLIKQLKILLADLDCQ